MEIHLGNTDGQMPQQAGDSLLGHRAGPGEAEDLIRCAQASTLDPRLEQRDPRRRAPIAAMLAAGLYAIQYVHRFRGHPYGAQAVARSDVENLTGDGRVQLKMMVTIDVIEDKPGRLIRRELRGDFCRKLLAHLGAKENIHARPDHALAKTPVCIDKVRNALGWQHRPAVDQNKVQAHAKRGEAPGAGHGIVNGRSAYHQARRGQDAIRVRDLDRLVDLGRQAKVIGGNDERLQCTVPRRSRRK